MSSKPIKAELGVSEGVGGRDRKGSAGFPGTGSGSET